MGFCEECEPIQSYGLCPCGTPGSQALVDLLDPFLPLSLLRQCPAAQDGTTRCIERKSLLHSEMDGSFRALLGSAHFTAKLMELGSNAQSLTEAKGVCTL